jgi:hypothetical protein
LRSKSDATQINEALCKLLCHNLCVISRTTKHLELRFSSLLNEEDSRVTPMLDSS